MLHSIDTTHAAPVTKATLKVFSELFPAAPQDFIQTLFQYVEKLFTGSHPDYQANDLPYHDFQHTLQVSVAYVDLFSARQKITDSPLSSRQFELGLAAALLHDSGYLKLRSDLEGTGAKYTFCHVLRSCAIAASYLPRIGLQTDEIDTVLSAIRITGPSTTGMKLRFVRQEDQLLASMVGTADYLGQMAADDYPDELELLYNEFAESDAFLSLPASQRMFKSARSIIDGSTAFWHKVVKPKFANDYQGVYRFLTQPDGHNPYLDAIEKNLDIIESRRSQPTT